jgi:hypothetical protein
MSQYPRVVLSPVEVAWGETGCSIWVRAGSMVDIEPGSALEAAYGAGNLSGVLVVESDPVKLDKSALSN